MLKTKLPIAVFAILILVIPHIVRFVYYDNFMPGETSYYHARIARDLLDGTTTDQPTAYHYLLAKVGSKIGILTASNIIPFIAGILSVFIFYLIITRFGMNRLWVCMFWIISPLFAYSFIMSEPTSVVTLLLLTGGYFYTGKHPWISIIPFSIIPLFGYEYAVLTMIMLGIYAIHEKKGRLFFSVLATTVIISILYPVTSLNGPEINNVQDNIVGLGASMGFNIFVLVLSIIGLIYRWRIKKKLWFVYVWLVVLIVAVFIDTNYKVILNILIGIFAVEGLLRIYSMNWELKLIKNLTLFILGAGILFSTGAYLHTISFSEPSVGTIDSLYWLKSNSLNDDIILSHPGNVHWINYFSQRESFSDSSIFTTRDEETAVTFFEENNINFVYVDEKTRALMINENNIIGLVFLMENSAHFQKRVEGNIDIWQYET